MSHQEAAPVVVRGHSTTLDASLPILLLPVRIETRFVDNADNQPSLLLRVYPDTISVSSFEPELTSDEIGDGQEYWNLVWRAGVPPQPADAPASAWRGLASRYSPQRAAWIAFSLTPTNVAAQPAAPTPDGSDPNPQPSFPTPAKRASSYEKAPTAAFLPDRWFVYLECGLESRVVQGRPIAASLAVGLSPRDGNFPDGLPADAGMRWLIDFDEAVKVGMGLRIPLSATERAAGFDRITVVGVRQTKKDGAGDVALATLLQNHHYTDGLAFVPQGAPTNNTPDASSAYSQKDPDYATSLKVDRGAPLTSDSTADGPLAAAMLGLATSAFDHVQHADGHGRLNGRDMLLALWPATLGYFIEQMMDPVFNPVRQDEARAFALSNGAPRGLLPALRVGKTPYGVLPVTSLSVYPPPSVSILRLDNPEAALAGLVKQLLPAWRTSIDGVPRVGGTNDPDQDLAHVLGMDASSVDFRARQVLGDQTVWNLFQLLAFGAGSEEWWLEHEVRGRALLNSLGLGSWSPRVLQTSMARDSYPVPYPNVQDGPLSETDALKNDATVGAATMNYITWLQTATLADIWAENYPGPKPTSLLYRILRQSVLREYVTIAGRAQIAAGTLARTALREQELVNVAHATPTVTPREIVERPVAPGSALSWADFIHALGPAPEPQYVRFAELRDSLGRLAKLPTAELDRLMTETLDACSHRIDVWASAIANSILQRRRAGQQNQSPRLHLGAYGWVEYVRAAPTPTPLGRADTALVTRLDRDRQQRIKNAAGALRPVVQPPADNGGYIHAPSMTQAAAGAVLRSGWLSHRNSPDEPVLEVDLSSERVRRALWLLDGVRRGQSLGALTGYIFEEGMHEASLDTYVQPFRDTYPLIGDELTASTAAGTQMPPPQVVDGVKLRAAWQAGTFTAGQYWGPGLPLPSPPANVDQTAVLTLLADIDDRMDGLADMSLAESVFQIMRGNYGRAGGMLDAISRGDHPPDPDIVTTPRAGSDITHRLMLLLAGAPPAVAAWSGLPSRPRAIAEPWLNDWIGSRLPDPAIVRCRVGWTAGAAAQSVTVSLADLGAGPLDVIAMADAADRPQKSELESRILYKAAPPTGATALTITYDTAGLPPGSLRFPDVMFAVRTLRDLLGAARPLDPAAFSLPQDDAVKAGGTVDTAELKTRADSLLARLGNDITALQTALGNVAAAPQPVLDALIACSFYGVTDSVPRPPAVAGDLAAQGTAVLAEMQKRQAAAGTTSASMTADDLLAVIAAVLGKSALILPHFKAPDLVALQSSFAQSSAMTATDPLAPRRWLLQLSHVRSAPMRLDLAMSATELLGAPHLSDLALAQLPPVANDRWLGLPLDPAHPLAQGRVAIEAIASGDPAAAPVFAGLMLDQFLDRIPSPDTSAGVAFHFDEPDARAPQALLLAVCPDERKTWDIDLLRTILDETLELAKIRGVDLDSLQEAGQILPALYFPFNIPEATPSIRFLDVGEADAVLRANLS
jgi:hypothetical protein